MCPSPTTELAWTPSLVDLGNDHYAVINTLQALLGRSLPVRRTSALPRPAPKSILATGPSRRNNTKAF